MKVKQVIIAEPRNKQSALNLSAYYLQQKDNIVRRRENLMKNIKDTESKLKRLEETLDQYKEQLIELQKIDNNSSKALENLQAKFELTMAEILETKSALLRNQIENLRRQAGIQDSMQDKLI